MSRLGRTREVVDIGVARIDLIAEGEGPLVVLLPSRGRGSEDFDDVAAGIAAAGFRVLRPQPRGAGASRGPVAGVTLGDLARDVALIIEREAAGSAVVAGHAFGSWVARMIATEFPNAVSGIVLMAAASRVYPPELHAVVEAAGDLSKTRAERIAALQRGFFAPGQDASPWLEGWAPEAIRIQRAAVAATPQATYWRAGDVSLLDLVAEHDPFKPRERWYETVEDFGARAEVRLIPHASHALLPEQPRAVVAAIVDWIRGQSGRG